MNRVNPVNNEADMLVDEIELILLRSIVERKEKCRQAAELVADYIHDAIGRRTPATPDDVERAAMRLQR